MFKVGLEVASVGLNGVSTFTVLYTPNSVVTPSAIPPPIDRPVRLVRARPRASRNGLRNAEYSLKPQPEGMGSLSPKPGKSGAKTRHISAKVSMADPRLNPAASRPAPCNKRAVAQPL